VYWRVGSAGFLFLREVIWFYDVSSKGVCPDKISQFSRKAE
jgi:hypothetical protein